jgi:hypothetical protein
MEHTVSTFMHMNKNTSGKNNGVAVKRSERYMSVNTMKDTSGKKPGRPASRSKPKPSARPGVMLARISRYEFYCDHIRRRAYEIYCDRNERRRGGDHVSDWLQAERELAGALGAEARAHRSPIVQEGVAERTSGQKSSRKRAASGWCMPEVDRNPLTAPKAEHALGALVSSRESNTHPHEVFVTRRRHPEHQQTPRNGPNAQY